MRYVNLPLEVVLGAPLRIILAYFLKDQDFLNCSGSRQSLMMIHRSIFHIRALCKNLRKRCHEVRHHHPKTLSGTREAGWNHRVPGAASVSRIHHPKAQQGTREAGWNHRVLRGPKVQVELVVNRYPPGRRTDMVFRWPALRKFRRRRHRRATGASTGKRYWFSSRHCGMDLYPRQPCSLACCS